MRIGELAKRANISRDAIRFYERNGLIASSSPEQNNNYRHYPADAVPTLALIKEAQAAGLTLADLRRFMDQLTAASAEDFDGEAFLQEKIEEVERRIDDSRRFLRTLRETKAALARAPLS